MFEENNMELNDFFNKINKNVKNDNKKDFIKGLQSNVVNKRKSLDHFNELVANKSKKE